MPPKEVKTKELKFFHYGIQYIYKFGKIYDANGNFICDVDISYTNYADNEEVLRICCFCALEAYEQGKKDGVSCCKTKIKEFLGV